MQLWLRKGLIFVAIGVIAFAINGGILFSMMSEKPTWNVTASIASNIFFELALAMLCLAAANQIKPFGNKP
jgi:lipoprotein signal peptidase